MTQDSSGRQKTPPKQPKTKPRQDERDPLPELRSQREFESLGDGCFRRMPTQRD